MEAGVKPQTQYFLILDRIAGSTLPVMQSDSSEGVTLTASAICCAAAAAQPQAYPSSEM